MWQPHWQNAKHICRGVTPPSFNIHSPDITPHVMAVLMTGFWLIVVCKPTLGLVAAMLVAKYPK